MAMIKQGKSQNAHEIHDVSCVVRRGTSADRQVWAADLESEFALLRTVIEDYPYISMVSLDSEKHADQASTSISSRLVLIVRTPSFQVS